MLVKARGRTVRTPWPSAGCKSARPLRPAEREHADHEVEEHAHRGIADHQQPLVVEPIDDVHPNRAVTLPEARSGREVASRRGWRWIREVDTTGGAVVAAEEGMAGA
eukprot:5294925-Prymnesium_polylepis.2